MILVTGATGFVGQALCEELTRRRIAFRPTSRIDRDGFFVTGAIDGDTDWSQGLDGVTTVIHLAARVHVMDEAATDPLAEFRRANVDTTLNLARQAAASGVNRLIFLSSVKVNGESTHPDHPFTAKDEPRPDDPYGQSKWEAERALVQLGSETGLEIVVIRPPLVYGPGVKANFASLISWVKRGIPLPLGALVNRRSLIFVRNLADFILLCVNLPNASNQTLLVSDGRDLAVSELLRVLADKLGVRSRLFPVPRFLLRAAAGVLGQGATARRLLDFLQVDISDTLRITGWSPPYTVDEGLRQTAVAFLADKAGSKAPEHMP